LEFPDLKEVEDMKHSDSSPKKPQHFQ